MGLSSLYISANKYRLTQEYLDKAGCRLNLGYAVAPTQAPVLQSPLGWSQQSIAILRSRSEGPATSDGSRGICDPLSPRKNAVSFWQPLTLLVDGPNICSAFLHQLRDNLREVEELPPQRAPSAALPPILASNAGGMTQDIDLFTKRHDSFRIPKLLKEP